jgi:hypothetical protein
LDEPLPASLTEPEKDEESQNASFLENARKKSSTARNDEPVGPVGLVTF